MRMRQFLLALVLQLGATVAVAQMAYIPDTNFRAFLQGEYPNCMVGDSLNTQCSEVMNETSLLITNLQIGELTGVEAFVNLDTLWCWGNQLVALPNLPIGLLSLRCMDNYGLTQLPALPEGLEFLECSYTGLTELPVLPMSLKGLRCGAGPLTHLPTLPNQLEYLACGNTEITELPDLPESLESLLCGSNQLTYLPELPSSLTWLECQRQNITELPDLPAGLQRLNCWWNQITQLPELPSILEHLTCSRNQLTGLPELPENLIWLNCSENQIEVMPPLPSNLEEFSVYDNLISCLPYLPESITGLSFSGNNIDCVPNIPSGLSPTAISQAGLEGMPICTVNNIHDCTYLVEVSGKVYHDANESCGVDAGEIGLRDRVVMAGNGRYAISDSNGDYSLFLDSGQHTLGQTNQILGWGVNCTGIPYLLAIDSIAMDSVDFPNKAQQSCSWLTVEVGSWAQRPCFNNSIYHFNYCNLGSATATDAYVNVWLPSEVFPLSSSVPWSVLGNGWYRFEVGDIDPNECGSISLIDSVDCEAMVGSTVCVKAEIYPMSQCMIPTVNWDGSSIAVDGHCDGQTASFTIRNSGSGDMSVPSEYRLYEDNQLLYIETLLPINSGDSVVITQPANGATLKMEVDQVEGHAGISLPRAFVEVCGSTPYSMGQITASIQDDIDDYRDAECIELTAAYDPNDKRVVPAGYGPEHFVHPNDSLLEYTIRFQNTGSDTAFNVEVVDTLPTAFLNPVSFLSGVSSHPYTVRMHGNGIVTWRFENILLPDSTTNEAGSHGFVKFKIRTMPNLPNGTVINNRANIYFDFNAAIVTETCFITISDQAIIASNAEVAMESRFEAYPNPSTGLFNLAYQFEVGVQPTLQLRDMLGRMVKTAQLPSNKGTYTLDASGLGAGVYFCTLLNGTEVLATQKLSVVKEE